MLRRVAAFCRPLRPVLLLVSFPRSRSPVFGVPGAVLVVLTPPPLGQFPKRGHPPPMRRGTRQAYLIDSPPPPPAPVVLSLQKGRRKRLVEANWRERHQTKRFDLADGPCLWRSVPDVSTPDTLPSAHSLIPPPHPPPPL